MTGEPEIVVQLLQIPAAHFRKAMTEDFLAGTIQQQDASAKIGGNQSASHRVNDVFGKVLQAEQFFALLFEFHALFPKRLG